MRTWKLASAALILVPLVLAGGYFFAKREADEALDRAVSQLRKELGPHGSFEFASSQTSPFAGTALLKTIVIRTGDGTLITADVVRVSRGHGERLGPIDARVLRVVADGSTVTAASASVDGLQIPAAASGSSATVDPSLLAFEDAEVTDVSFADRGKIISVAVIHADHYGLGQAGAAIVQGIDLPVPDQPEFDRLGLAEASISGVDLAMIVSDLTRNQDAPAPQVSDGKASISGLFMMRDGHEIFRLSSASLAGSATRSGRSSVRFEVSGVDLRPSDKGKDVLAGLGYGVWDLGAGLDMDYDIAGGQLNVSKCRIGIDGVGSAALAMRLAHVPLEASAYANVATYGTIQFMSGSVSFQDDGLVNHLLATVAERYHIDEATARARIVAALRSAAGSAPLAVLRQLEDGAAQFVMRPGTIELTLDPPTPLSAAMIVRAADDPGELSDKLGGTVRLVQ